MAYINGNEVLFSTQFTGIVNIDQTYDAASENPQSGKAVAEAAAAAVNKAKKEAGALTLIDSVTLTEAVSVYAVTLPANTYREVYVAAEIKLGGTASNNWMMLSVRENQNGYRVCAVTDTFSAGDKLYLSARMLRLPSRGTCGIISYGKDAYLNAKTSMSPGAGNTASATGYLFGCHLSVVPQYTENTALMDVGTKIQIWGR